MIAAASACLAMMLIDIVTGVAGGIRNKELSSTKMREGVFNKFGIVAVLVAAYACEYFTGAVPDLGVSLPIFVPACAIVFFMELASIIENVGKINPSLNGSRLLELFEKKG